MFGFLKRKPQLLDPASVYPTKMCISDLESRFKVTYRVYSHPEKWEAYYGKSAQAFLNNLSIYMVDEEEEEKGQWVKSNFGMDEKGRQHIQLTYMNSAHPTYGKPKKKRVTVDLYIEKYGMFEKKKFAPRFTGREKANRVAEALVVLNYTLPAKGFLEGTIRNLFVAGELNRQIDKLNNKQAEEEDKE